MIRPVLNFIESYIRLYPLMKELGYRFKRISILERALTHPSASSWNNQRLEFLGDAVLETIVSEFLYSRYPDINEGTLTQLKIMNVNNVHLRSVAINLKVANYLKVSSGLAPKNHKGKIHADAMEAIIGAIYLDGGLRPAKRFVLRFVVETLPSYEETQKHPKTVLANWTSKQRIANPVYQTRQEPNPPKSFDWTVNCSLKSLSINKTATHRSRKEAEKRAAAAVLTALDVLPSSS